MSERTVYHVLPKEDGWRVAREGAERAASVHETKDAAITRGRELAGGDGLGQLIVHRRDGTIETEYTYGEDPYPPEG